MWGARERMKKPQTVAKLSELGRVQLSKSFYMRDFLYSDIAAIHGHQIIHRPFRSAGADDQPGRTTEIAGVAAIHPARMTDQPGNGLGAKARRLVIRSARVLRKMSAICAGRLVRSENGM